MAGVPSLSSKSSMKSGDKRKNASKTPLYTNNARKLHEKQRILDLDNAVAKFVINKDLEAFADLPISEMTKRGLKKSSFVKMTEIQAQSLPISLKGKDVLGAARTGSGKTLAFLIPVLETLYRRKWGSQDGLGALIISPTRELAVQIFDVLRSIGGYHTFSAGLVIGGKNLRDESERLAKMNILVATPGRLLQHLDQTAGFDTDNLQMLVLDEADRILDLGFSRTLSALLAHLPKSRQTLLFSATQTRSVADLARLSLKEPVNIGIEQPSETGQGALGTSNMPTGLSQHYSVVPLPQKLSVLWSFIRTHLQSKSLVFLSSTKQVRFVYETFRRMQPGVPLLHLHGKQKQTARLGTYERFAKAKEGVLFATDIAARGLDFARVDWVVQVDAPEDAETYIHRVGRTARYESAGSALLLLCPTEVDGMLARLEAKDLQVSKIKIRESKTQDISTMLQNLAFKEPEVKYLAQRAFVSYMKSIHLQKDKTVFKVTELPGQEFASSLGLAGAPKIKFLTREKAKQRGAQAQAEKLDDSESDESTGSEGEDNEDGDGDPSSASVAKPSGVRTKYDRMFERKNQDVLSEHYSKLVDHDGEPGLGQDDSDDEFITLARANHQLSDDDNDAQMSASGSQPAVTSGNHARGLNNLAQADVENISKRKLKAGQSKKLMLKYREHPQHLKFDDEGNARDAYEIGTAEDFYKVGEEGVKEAERKFALGERERLKEADIEDREHARERRREKKRKRKENERQHYEMDDDPTAATIGAEEVDDGYVSPDFDLPSEDEAAKQAPVNKRRKHDRGKAQDLQDDTLEGDEALALRLLRART